MDLSWQICVTWIPGNSSSCEITRVWMECIWIQVEELIVIIYLILAPHLISFLDFLNMHVHIQKCDMSDLSLSYQRVKRILPTNPVHNQKNNFFVRRTLPRLRMNWTRNFWFSVQEFTQTRCTSIQSQAQGPTNWMNFWLPDVNHDNCQAHERHQMQGSAKNQCISVSTHQALKQQTFLHWQVRWRAAQAPERYSNLFWVFTQ